MWSMPSCSYATPVTALRLGVVKSGRSKCRPARQGCLDETLGVAVGPGHAGSCPNVPEAGFAAGVDEIVQDIARSVVGNNLGDGDAEAGIGGDLAPGRSCSAPCSSRI